MKASNFDVELAEKRVEDEKQQMIKHAQASLVPTAEAECIDCGEPISAARKKVLPSAKTCMRCQMLRERPK